MSMTGIKMTHVPYKGAGPHSRLIGGQVHVMFDNMPSSIEFIRGGKLRALASPRQNARPSCRTCRPSPKRGLLRSERGFGWAPPRARRRRDRAAQSRDHAALADPKMKARLAELGGDPISARPPNSGKFTLTKREVGESREEFRRKGRLSRRQQSIPPAHASNNIPP